ncbi:putative bifunctional diguanylate cyclase/phosphodiesterase [Paraburkholderia solisilvae]|uniref:putative bifunctional diguanylate cyclase/phosphodiesterase n=1 Tax=Paraburkholderia solisilvae TaxID=624376 RepID=UPI0015842E44|nr:EAL domain-containing protein [Paraburkholderia solisilvae]
MSFIKRLSGSRIAPAARVELRRSQFRAFRQQVPLLYTVLIVDTVTVAFTHWRIAPVYLAVYAPLLLCLFCTARLALWLRLRRRTLSDDEIARRLRTTVWMVAAVGVAFTAWAMSLYRYGDAYTRSHIAFYLAMTVIGCIFCLMHMRLAALLLAGIVIVPFTFFFASTHNPVFIAMAVNVFLVAVVMVLVLLFYYRDFTSLVESQVQLRAQHAETQRLSDENFRLANLDGLTNLPNRRRFFADLDHQLMPLQGQARAPGSLAIGVIDLDGFKRINDLYGHAFGDRVLEETGRRFAAQVTPQVSVARIGGDEFGLTVVGATAYRQLLDLGDTLCAAIERSYVLPEGAARLSASIGFANFPEAGETTTQLVERAYYALHFAQAHRRGGTVIFSPEHETQIRHLSKVEACLRSADFEREITLHFQPIFDTGLHEIMAFEALARWTSPVLGVVAPSMFIPVAERCDLIHALTEVLLRKALDAARSWPEAVRISFNLSARDLNVPGALHRVIRTTLASGVAPHRIDFEITETALIQDFGQARIALESLKKLGARISLDDFGTGFSSLNSVHRLPIDKVKVDGSFVAGIEREPTARAIVKSIVELCENLGLACVIEGVETRAQANALRELGATVMQGHLFGKPVPAGQVLDTYVREPLLSRLGRD